MATIKLTNSDLRKMISEAVSKLCEGQWYQSEPLCRLPYFVSVNFSDHAIVREDERDLNENDIVDDLKLVVQDVIKDFDKKKLLPGERFKVIDRDRCIVIVCGINPTYNKKRIHQISVITAYIWDGRVNIDYGHTYYLNEPSEEYLEAKKWNAENQDKVISYTEWKRGTDVERQRKKADKEYYFKTHPQEPSRERRMYRLDRAYDQEARREKEDIHDSLPDGELDAIRDYFRNMDSKKIKLEPMAENARRAPKQPVSEALTDSTNANMAAAKKAGNDEFYTQRGDVEKELINYAQYFKGKKVYCPCDGPQSEIFKWLLDNCLALGIEELFATSYKNGIAGLGGGALLWANSHGEIKVRHMLKGNGSFDSDECRKWMQRCDIVVTNPPFTLFSKLVSQCIEYGKKFILLGNKNAVSTKTMFNLMRTGEVHFGYTWPGEFKQPEGDQIKRMGGLTRWFTNLPVRTDKKFAPTAEYDPQRHLKPDNEEDEVINVDSIRDIPYNYDGKMLVPITIFDQGLDQDEYDILKMVRPVVGGKRKFVRVLIQKKQPQGEPAIAQSVMNEVVRRLRKLK